MKKISRFQFRGTGVAIVTPFLNGKIDFDGLERVIEHVVEGGVDYIIALGSTGEAAVLSWEEQKEVLRFCGKVVSNRKPLVAGNFAGNNTDDLVEKIKSFHFEGIDAILSASPAYVKPTQEGIYRHYEKIATNCPVPVILYNVPGRTQSNIEWYTTVRIAKDFENIIGIKEASGNISQITKIIKYRPHDFLVISGDDETALATVAIGGDGVISVIANALPEIFSRMISSALSHDYEAARNLNLRCFDLHHWLYREGNPAGIKAALEVLNLCSREVRLPLTAMTDESFAELKRIMHQLKW